jgi:hypothetical protein
MRGATRCNSVEGIYDVLIRGNDKRTPYTLEEGDIAGPWVFRSSSLNPIFAEMFSIFSGNPTTEYS